MEDALTFLDYSQYKAWMKCPHYWHERYVNCVEPVRAEAGYRNDALAIGSLTHSGLENWAKSKQPRIDPAVVAEIGPSPEALALATSLVQTYVSRFPDENFQFEHTEEPMLFELANTPRTGFALVDNFFYNPAPCEINNGVEGETFALEPGWWIREYKTKDVSRSRPQFAQSWAVNMQADFQMHALARRVGEPVRGIFVCVLEKPRVYTPQRKCKGCNEMLELALYLPTGDGHACPLCGAVQKLTPYKPKIERRPDVYRMRVTRTPTQLEESLRQMALVAAEMDKMLEQPALRPMNKEACLSFGSPCDYFNNHTYAVPTVGDPLMRVRDTTKYARLELLRVA
jgi:hypothetical protein